MNRRKLRFATSCYLSFIIVSVGSIYVMGGLREIGAGGMGILALFLLLCCLVIYIYIKDKDFG